MFDDDFGQPDTGGGCLAVITTFLFVGLLAALCLLAIFVSYPH